jgi:thioredoxin 1
MGFLSYWKKMEEVDKLAIELNRDNFESEILNSKEPVLVDFWGPQCKPCFALMPVVDRIEKDYAGRLKVAKVNAAGNRMLCARLRVMGLPTFLFYKGGAETKRLTGENITESDIIEAIKTIIS